MQSSSFCIIVIFITTFFSNSAYSFETEKSAFIYKNDNNNSTEPSGALSWGAGLLSGLVILLCSACGLLLTPLTAKPWYKKFLLYLVSTATSSLLGNSLFQLIPPAYGVEVDVSDEENIWKSAACYLAFVTFFVIERVLKLVFKDDEEEKNENEVKYEVKGEVNKAAFERNKSLIPDSRRQSKLSVNLVKPRAGSTLGGIAINSAMNAAELLENAAEKANAENVNDQTTIPEDAVLQEPVNLTLWQKMRKVKMFAWMLFIGDALENIADGMAMGAAFGQSIALGIGITIAIFSEELQEEIEIKKIALILKFLMFFLNLFSHPTKSVISQFF